jgi:hypothetical protein
MSDQTQDKPTAPISDDLKLRGKDALRSASQGWKQIASGKKESRQTRIIKENQERFSGNVKNEQVGFRPGDDAPSELPTNRQLKESYKQATVNKRVFNGTADQIALKMVVLFENEQKVKIMKVEQSGYNTFKMTYELLG